MWRMEQTSSFSQFSPRSFLIDHFLPLFRRLSGTDVFFPSVMNAACLRDRATCNGEGARTGEIEAEERGVLQRAEALTDRFCEQVGRGWSRCCSCVCVDTEYLASFKSIGQNLFGKV